MKQDNVKQDNIQDIPFGKALGERYLAYALSTIMSRSLPDVRDGLKPVHRRLIYAMQQLKLNPNSPFKKSARVVGDVMGKFHPHGDGAIYDALVRLAQEFSVRYPLIDGQGNFGNIDGDNAAAMRYTEARLTDAALQLMEGLDENAIDFKPTYDNEAEEPCVFPAAIPNLLANGASGIAVGMATSVPPHNLAELCDALQHLIEHNDATVADLMKFIKGPDFPTGGVLIESQRTIQTAYETGKGSFRIRAKWQAEQIKGGSYRVVVTEIPYQVQKSKLIEKIADLMLAKKLPLLGDIIDESTDEMRLVLEPRSRTVEPAVLMESLFRATDLESRFSLNMNVLDMGRKPMVMDLRQVLQAFLSHRREVLQRRSQHRLAQIAHRLEVLSGYLVAYLNLDEVIRIIRDEDEPKAVLQERFELTEVQAEAILNMRLRSLRKLQEIEIRKEHGELCQEQDKLQKLLDSPRRQWTHISKDLDKLAKLYGHETELGRRRTEIGEPPTTINVPIEAVIEKEDITILCSEKGWIRALKGHQLDTSAAKYKDGDKERFTIKGQTTDKLLVMFDNGRCYTVGADKLSRGRGTGDPLSQFFDLQGKEKVVQIVLYRPGRDESVKYLLASRDGRGFCSDAQGLLAQTKTGKQVMNPAEGERVSHMIPVEGDHVAVIGINRKLLIFPLSELPELSKGRGVILQRYKPSQEVKGGISDIKTFVGSDGLRWIRGGKNFHEDDIRPWLGHRAAAGKLAPLGFPRTNTFS